MGYGVANNSGILNSQGAPPQGLTGKTSYFIANVIPAGGNLVLPVAGTEFYLTTASGAVTIQPVGGVANSYTVGTGLKLNPVNAFTQLMLSNPDPVNAVAFQLFVGFDEYLDKRLIISQISQPAVLYPTSPVPASLTVINIPDLSGQEFIDVNGGKWFALSRIAILVFNLDAAVTTLVQNSTTTGDAPLIGPPITNPAVAAVYPNTTLRLDNSGNFRIGGANNAVLINCIVSEIYQAIAKPN